MGQEKAIYLSVILSCAATGALSAFARSEALSQTVQHFQVDNLPVEDALKELARSGAGSFVIGIEMAEPKTKEPLTHLSMDGGTVVQIITSLCTQDKRYTYSDAGQGVVDVYPVQQPAPLRNALELPVPQLDLDVHQWPQNVMARPPEFVPELQTFLTQEAAEWAHKTGRSLPGSPGVIMTTNVEPPLLSISLRKTTVRGVLNALAAFTIRKKEVADPPELGPSGWKAEFLPDAQAPTGMGGYLKFGPFP